MDLPIGPPQLVRHNRRPERDFGQLSLPASPQLTEFLEAVAGVGLDVSLAVRLTVERALVLHDAQWFRIALNNIRPTLNRAAADTRASQPLSAKQSAYVRTLNRRTPRTALRVTDHLEVLIPDDLITRLRESAVRESRLLYEAVPEILNWERAARLQGHTMTEWAFKVLARKATELAQQGW